MSIYRKAADTQCQMAFCEGYRTLNPEERNTPAVCTLCGKRMCDACVFGVRIPYDVLGMKPWGWKEHYKQCPDIKRHGKGICPHDKPTDGQRYECLVCSSCFKEEWV